MENDLRALVARILLLPGVEAVGLSSGERPLPAAGEGDIDLFVYGERIPALAERARIYAGLGNLEVTTLGAIRGGPWGFADSLRLCGVETWVMYFRSRAARREVEQVLAGRRLDRSGAEFYPVGRCAMLRQMRILADPGGVLAGLKERVSEYPEQMALAMWAYHLAGLRDFEDLDRAVLRGDVPFYHFALDRALDHFLLALFALNRQFFPSRKRSFEALAGFACQPRNCEARLSAVIAAGGSLEGLPASRREWGALVEDLAACKTD